MGLITAASVIIPRKSLSAVQYSALSEKSLYLHHVYTGESLRTVYWKEGRYIPQALTEINYLFRDTRTGKVMAINTELLDLLCELGKNTKSREPFYIVSGYRTPRSNAYLRKTTKGVARNSLHMYGKAVDIRLPGYRLESLRYAAMELRRGGVGYYPHSHFIHVDVGSVRYWSE